MMNKNPETSVISFGEKIRRHRIQQNMTQSELASSLGMTKNAVANWEADRTRPDLAKVPEVCRRLNISLVSFFGMQESDEAVPHAYYLLEERNREIVNRLIDSLLDMQEQEYPVVHLDDIRRVYWNTEKASAGLGNMLSDSCGEYVYLHLNASQRMADEVIAVAGDSMEPTFRSGELLLVEHTAMLRSGEIGIFTVDGQGYVKEYREDGLHSHNPAYGVLRFAPDSDVHCVGRVLGRLDMEQLASDEEIQLMEEKRRSKRPMKRRIRA